MNNPASYEFADLKLMDSVLYSDNINYRKKHFQQKIKSSTNLLAVIAPYEKEFPKIWEETKKEETEKLKTEIKKMRKFYRKLTNLNRN